MSNVKLTLLVPPEVKQKLKQLSELHRRSMTSQIVFSIEKDYKKAYGTAKPTSEL